MSRSAPIRETIDFIDRPDGHRCRAICEPAAGSMRGVVLLAPPFAEELNKTRRMCARMARMLAADGWRVVRMDPYGCGDSAGEFRDATWERWVDDLCTEARTIDTDASEAWIWCVRAGALFAPALLDVLPGANLLLWQPVLKGATHLQQFLRLSLAARLFGAGKSPTGEATPAQRLAIGQTIEVGGYELPPFVANGLRAAVFQLATSQPARAIWIDIAMDVSMGVSPATVRASDELKAAAWQDDVEQLPGAPFWQTAEVVENEALLLRSRVLMSAPSGSPLDAG